MVSDHGPVPHPENRECMMTSGMHTKKEVLKKREAVNLKVGPVMSLLKNVQSITLEVNLAIKVELMEGLHGDLVCHPCTWQRDQRP